MPVRRFVAGKNADARRKIGARECGSQPAHQSLITDVLVPPPPMRDNQYQSPINDRANLCVPSLDKQATALRD